MSNSPLEINNSNQPIIWLHIQRNEENSEVWFRVPGTKNYQFHQINEAIAEIQRQRDELGRKGNYRVVQVTMATLHEE